MSGDMRMRELLARLENWSTPDGLDVEPRHAKPGGTITFVANAKTGWSRSKMERMRLLYEQGRAERREP